MRARSHTLVRTVLRWFHVLSEFLLVVVQFVSLVYCPQMLPTVMESEAELSMCTLCTLQWGLLAQRRLPTALLRCDRFAVEDGQYSNDVIAVHAQF